MTNTPQPTTVLLASIYPTWWAAATTVEIVTTSGSATFNVGDVELYPHGVAFPADPAADWAAGIVPWAQIVNVHQAS